MGLSTCSEGDKDKAIMHVVGQVRGDVTNQEGESVQFVASQRGRFPQVFLVTDTFQKVEQAKEAKRLLVSG